MSSNTKYISQLLESDIYDSESLLTLRDQFFKPEEVTALEQVEVVDRFEVETELTDLSEEFWNLNAEKFSSQHLSLSQRCGNLSDLKQHLDKLFIINAQRSLFTKLAEKPRLSQVFIKDFKELLTLRGKKRQAFELQVYENIKNSKQQKSVQRTIKSLQKEIPELTEFHEDWLLKTQQIKIQIKHEKTAGKRSFDWVWISLGIFMLIRFILAVIK